MKNFFKILVILTILMIASTIAIVLYSFGVFSLSEAPQDTQREVSLYQPVIDYETAVIEAVQRSEPSVVSVIATRNLPQIEQCLRDPFGFLLGPCIPGEDISVDVGSGSGFIVSEDGFIVTNKHVVNDDDAEYSILMNDGVSFSAEVLARDPFQDIAIMKIEASNLTPVVLGNSDELKMGQTAIAIGNALGEFQNTVSAGVVSGLNRSTIASGGGIVERLEGVIQTDAGINRGNSGGPLLNLRGEVIGVNTAVVSGAQNIGFAIPINMVKRAINSVKETGTIEAPFLGIHYLMVTQELADEEGLEVSYGAIVYGPSQEPPVVPGSAAEQAGLIEGDIILEIDGKRLTSQNSLRLVIQHYRPGEIIEMKVLREEQEITLFATLTAFEE